MSATDELKPCPFCGGEATVNIVPFINAEGSGYVAQCESCWAKSGYYQTKAEAIEAWNRRIYDHNPVADELSKCAIMNRLRQELDKRGCKWRDDSSVMGGPSFHYHHVMLRTKWEHDGEEVSVIWGYFDLDDGERTWMTYGAPDMLECLYRPNDPDPIPMTVDEILEVCA